VPKKQQRRRSKNPSFIYWENANRTWVAKYHGQKKRSKIKAVVERWLAEQKALRTVEGKDALELPHSARVDAFKALRILPAGHTLEEAAMFFAEHLRRTRRTLTISAAVAEFLSAKSGASESHHRDLRIRLTRWSSVFSSDRTIDTVTKEELALFLANFKGQNAVNWRRVLINFFGWCTETGAAPANVVRDLQPPKVVPVRPATMDSNTVSELLRKALQQKRADVLAWLTLGGFCGLRPFEVLRLEWSAVQWETKEIRVEPYVTKTKRARIVPLQDNALSWLGIAHQVAGNKQQSVMPPESTWNNRWRRWREINHGISWWRGKDDVLRHSFGTYRAAVLRNAHALAEEMGNSVEVVRTHYDAVVSPSVARHWWAILPEEPQNIVSIAVA
jgi:integrase